MKDTEEKEGKGKAEKFKARYRHKPVILTIRTDEETYRALKADSDKANLTQSAFIDKILGDYFHRDTDIREQLLASNLKLHADARKLTDLCTMQSAMFRSFLYTFFITFAPQSAFEFMTEANTPDTQQLATALARQRNARLLMDRWTKKMLEHPDAAAAAVSAMIDGSVAPADAPAAGGGA